MITVLVEDMVCQSCVNAVTKELMKINGVESVKANANTGQVTIETARRSKVDIAYVEDAIHRAGYTMVL
ncbi:MAG: cation transporter [Lawsonella sp.]|nr:heavy-metal-associated domain-containing protein [Mycobacteriales bacterium]